MEHFEDVEIVANSNYNPKVHFIESFFTLFRAYDILLNLDRAFGLNANHRKYKLLPICSSGSSYKEYYLKLDTGEIYFLNPNSDMDVELDLESKKLANNVNEFVESFVCQSID